MPPVLGVVAAAAEPTNRDASAAPAVVIRNSRLENLLIAFPFVANASNRSSSWRHPSPRSVILHPASNRCRARSQAAHPFHRTHRRRRRRRFCPRGVPATPRPRRCRPRASNSRRGSSPSAGRAATIMPTAKSPTVSMTDAMTPPCHCFDPGRRSNSGRIGDRMVTSCLAGSAATTVRPRNRLNGEASSIC